MCCSREPPKRDVFVSRTRGPVPIEAAGGVSHNVPVRTPLPHKRANSVDSETSTTDDSLREGVKVDRKGKKPIQRTSTDCTKITKVLTVQEATELESFWSSTVNNKWWPFDQVVENEQTYCTASFAPGIRPGDIQVDVDGTTVHIEVQDDWDVVVPGDGHSNMNEVEHTKLHLYRMFELPSDVDTDAMYGNLTNAIFTLLMPKKTKQVLG